MKAARVPGIRVNLERIWTLIYQAASVVGATGDMTEASMLRDPHS